MLKCLHFLLLSCLVSHSETPPIRTHLMAAKRGGNITLPCNVENNQIKLIRRSKSIIECNYGECDNKTKNVQGVCKEGACDITLKNLSYSDAGIYIMRFTKENMKENETYQLRIEDDISVKIGEEQKLDVLLPNADKVQHQNKTSSEWTEVWSRTDGVQSKRLTDADGKLCIINFTASDAGTYKVLSEVKDSEEAILIIVNVTESDAEANKGLGYMEQHTRKHWIVPLCVGILAVIVIVILIAKAHRVPEELQNPQ